MKNLLKVFLMCFITLFAFAGQIMGQQKTITGRVVDALNEGMPCLLYTSPSPRDRG